MKFIFTFLSLILTCSLVQAGTYYPEQFALLEIEGVQLFANMKEPEEYFMFYQGRFFRVRISDKSKKADFLTNQIASSFYEIEPGEPKPPVDEPDDIPYMKFAKSTECKF